ncbi:MAG: VOC family protein [Acidimicrobiia bacterium]
MPATLWEGTAEVLKQLIHANIVVSDAERSVEFYTTALGGRVVREWVDESETAAEALGLGIGTLKFKAYLLRWGEGGADSYPLLDIVQFISPEAFGRPYPAMNHLGIARLCFEVDDIDATFEHVRSMGVRCLSEPKPINPRTKRGSITKVFAVYDPDGTVIELLGPLTR